MPRFYRLNYFKLRQHFSEMACFLARQRVFIFGHPDRVFWVDFKRKFPHSMFNRWTVKSASLLSNQSLTLLFLGHMQHNY